MTELGKNIPKHVAIVMDGNGRWAQKRGLPRLAGHNAGMKALKNIVTASGNLGIQYLTVYAFSTENWKRPEEEVSGIFKILIHYIEKELQELHENDVKVRVLGDYSVLPKEAIEKLEISLKTTENNRTLGLNIALNYGSRNEITRAVKAIAAEVRNGSLDPEDIDESLISSHLYTEGIPDPELIIRTGGELRLSNYLLWQSAYSEFIFTDIYWPDFDAESLKKCILEYQQRDRRFGGVKK